MSVSLTQEMAWPAGHEALAGLEMPNKKRCRRQGRHTGQLWDSMCMTIYVSSIRGGCVAQPMQLKTASCLNRCTKGPQTASTALPLLVWPNQVGRFSKQEAAVGPALYQSLWTIWKPDLRVQLLLENLGLSQCIDTVVATCNPHFRNSCQCSQYQQ